LQQHPLQGNDEAAANLSTFVAGKYRAAKDVIALVNRGSPGGSSRKGHTLTGLRGLSVKNLNSPWEKVDTATSDPVAMLLWGTPGFRTTAAAPYSRREVPTGPPLCYMCWTRGYRVPDCKIVGDFARQRLVVTFLRLRGDTHTACVATKSQTGATGKMRRTHQRSTWPYRNAATLRICFLANFDDQLEIYCSSYERC